MIHAKEPQKPKPKAIASVRVDKGATAPFSFKGYEPGQKAELTLSGKVISVRQDEYGSNLEIELSSGDSEKAQGSMKDDMKQMKKARQMPSYEE